MNNWNYPLRTVLPHLIAALVIFVICLVSGLFVSPEYARETIEQLGETLALLEHLGPYGWLAIIFLNNAIKALASIALGILLGLPPLIFVAYNGFIIGVVVSALNSVTGPGVVIASLAPHGIIELSVLIICSALGLSVGVESFKYLGTRNSRVREKLLRGVKFYVKWLLAALLIAAIIEVFVTPLVIKLSGGIEIMQ